METSREWNCHFYGSHYQFPSSKFRINKINPYQLDYWIVIYFLFHNRIAIVELLYYVKFIYWRNFGVTTNCKYRAKSNQFKTGTLWKMENVTLDENTVKATLSS